MSKPNKVSKPSKINADTAEYAGGFARGYMGADLGKIGERKGKALRVTLATHGAPDPRKDPAGFAAWMLAAASKASPEASEHETGAGPGPSDAPNAPE